MPRASLSRARCMADDRALAIRHLSRDALLLERPRELDMEANAVDVAQVVRGV